MCIELNLLLQSASNCCMTQFLLIQTIVHVIPVTFIQESSARSSEPGLNIALVSHISYKWNDVDTVFSSYCS